MTIQAAMKKLLKCGVDARTWWIEKYTVNGDRRIQAKFFENALPLLGIVTAEEWRWQI